MCNQCNKRNIIKAYNIKMNYKFVVKRQNMSTKINAIFLPENGVAPEAAPPVGRGSG